MPQSLIQEILVGIGLLLLVAGACHLVSLAGRGSRPARSGAVVRLPSPRANPRQSRIEPRPKAKPDRRKEAGNKAEFMVADVLSRTCDEAMGDIYLPSRDGATQIDHVGRRDGALFVVETKSLSGRIEAGERKRTWHQHGPGGHRPFQNPIHQNWGHAMAVRSIVGDEVDLVPLVAVVGNAEFVGGMPAGVVHVDDLERVMVEISDKKRHSSAARLAMVKLREIIAGSDRMRLKTAHLATVAAAAGEGPWVRPGN